jgi:methylmalonyl-CoA mutase C-terminal domain/subunit
MAKERKIKILVTKVGLDGHDRGAKVVSSLLKEAGMEVIYLGMYQTPEAIIKAAIDEDVDVIGVSYLSGEHLIFTPKIVEEMKKNDLDDVLLIAGGTFPAEDIPVLKEMGINEVFVAGSLTEPIIQYIQENVRKKNIYDL